MRTKITLELECEVDGTLKPERLQAYWDALLTMELPGVLVLDDETLLLVETVDWSWDWAANLETP